jgi:hypothetical protein
MIATELRIGFYRREYRTSTKKGKRIKVIKVKGVRSPNTGLRTSLRSGELRHGKLSAEV